ncbi:hypothetical protein AZE42_02551 [Rhizopogon vesiculosus]|uniref:Uncharacterized protein n=1 Tax=Rhizopogon vesiculosus TaxID=180088 RepID=A0A1J8RBJ0_9AGAM|nr:hypothetical protein AZE42_02551 [Rhizopogon vesiculosus]
MATVLNAPSLLPLISDLRGMSYFEVACLTVVVYDWGAHDTIVYRENY